MLFCLGRAECPVDTHVWEISKQVRRGWQCVAAGNQLAPLVSLGASSAGSLTTCC
jgi:hypothetical protein